MRRILRVSWITLLAALSTVTVLLIVTSGTSQADNPTDISVNTITDENDGFCGGSGNPHEGSDGDCSLRDAIAYANSHAGPDGIGFNASLFGTGNTISITYASGARLNITDDETWIDGDLDDDGVPEVEVRYVSGTFTGNYGLIDIRASTTTIEGLAVTSSPMYGIQINAGGFHASGNVIKNCWLGLDLTGADRGNSSHGVRIVYQAGVSASATGNVIQENVISGNGEDGIYVYGVSGTKLPGTQILSNTIGLDPSGITRLANDSDGMTLNSAVTTTVQGNLVSGNNANGIRIQAGTAGTTIVNNTIGLNSAGGTVGNGDMAGIYVENNANTTDLVITGNTVSGNSGNGIYLGTGSTGVVITDNRIGTNAAGTAGRGNGRTTNRDGIQILNAYSNTIGGPNSEDRNIIADNGRAGVFISGTQADYNVIQNNVIGADVNGALDLGNGEYPEIYGEHLDTGAGGIYLYDGADHNLVQDNLIRFNYVGLRFSGGGSEAVPPLTPPQHNQVLSNTLTSNDKYGIASKTTHKNTSPYATPAAGDNLIQNNVITGTSDVCSADWCIGIGILNYGSSPRIVSNTISYNDSLGIVNLVFFGVDGATNASDDILSMPYIAGNTIDGNDGDGIQSVDTAPANKGTVHTDNTILNNNANARVSQRWFVAVEVVSGTQTITSGLVVTITRQSGAATCVGGHCIGISFASAGGSDGIWGPAGISYTNVENTSDPEDPTTWFEVREYEVDWTGAITTYTSHLVRAGGAEEGVRSYSFDGITTTLELSGEVNLPFCQATGILSDSTNSLCRYQIAQIDVFGSFGDGDWDDDGIPDDEEGTGDSDGDGVPDYQDSDSDGDGIPDDYEYDACGTPPCDSDGDGIPDYKETDSDDDGIPDAVEGTGDVDGDGIENYRDGDSDGDGIPDADEAVCSSGVGSGFPCDSDGDGTPDYKDRDSDGDGAADNAEGQGDTDGDGVPNYRDTDSDDDGTPDNLDDDDDDDGIPDAVEGLVDNPGDENDSSVDTDGDGLPDYLDPDSDDDGIPDSIEGGPNPNDPVDTDGDTTPDYRDTDSDGDGISDDDEYYGGATDPGDLAFCTNAAGLNSDGDGDGNCQDNDVDGDSIPNYLDLDTDGDGTPDSQEGYPAPNAAPFTHGNVPAWADPVYRLYLPLVLRNF